jgi:hypothetical protein
MTDIGIYRRDMMVLTTCYAAGYPVATVIGGGYAEDLMALVHRHSLMCRVAKKII